MRTYEEWFQGRREFQTLLTHEKTEYGAFSSSSIFRPTSFLYTDKGQIQETKKLTIKKNSLNKRDCKYFINNDEEIVIRATWKKVKTLYFKIKAPILENSVSERGEAN